MRLPWVPLLLLLALAGHAFADDAESLTAQGEEKARSGEFTRAIELFKQADQLQPSAKHACLIALVYVRRELWSQAELFLDRCKERATATDPLPDWFPQATEQLKQKLAGVDVATVELHVEPAELISSAKIGVSSFMPDETFSARTIHLSPGVYVFTATLPDSTALSETATIKLGQTNDVTFKFPTKTAPTPPVTKPIANPITASPQRGGARPWSREKWLFVGAGAVLATGVVLNVLARSERSELADAMAMNDPERWDAHQGTFETDRSLSYAGIGIGLGLAVATVVFHYVRPAEHPPVTVVTDLAPGGMVIGLEVRR